MTNSTISDNHSNTSGGGISNSNGGILTLTTSIVSGNMSTLDGGGIFNSTGATLIVTNSTLSRNSSTNGNGGGIATNGTSTLIDSTFDENTARGEGGGILNTGALTMANSSLSRNFTEFDAGAGLFNAASATATISNSTLTANTSSDQGGGIANSGALIVTNSTFSANVANHGGGGIFNGASGDSTLANSSFANNFARFGSGGGVKNAGTMAMSNSTLSGNSASDDGGGLSNASTLTVTNCTIVGNSADSDDNSIGAGGGVSNSSTITLSNTIVAGNKFASGIPDELAGANVAAGSAFNLISNPFSAGGLVDGVHGNIVGKSGVILPLAEILDPTLRNNGGPTLTYALIPGSFALDVGNTTVVTPVAEIQTILPSGNLVGTFTLTFSGQTTGVLSGNGPAASVQAALNALPTIGGVGGSVAVVQAGTTFVVTFGGSLVNTNVPQMTATASGGLTVLFARPTEGNAGLLTDQRSDGFARVVGTQVDIGAFEMPRPLFTDNFNRGNSASLGAPWVQQAGTIGISGNFALGAGTATANLATIAGLSATDVDFYADAVIAPSQQAGILARYAGPGDKNYYLASITLSATGDIVAKIVRNVNGVATELAAVEVDSGPPAVGQVFSLRFRLVGSTMQLFLGGSLVASVQDNAFKSGAVGLRTIGAASADNFQVWPITTGADNIDSFERPDNTMLTDPWTRVAGFYRTLASQAAGIDTLNLAVLNAVQQADVDVQAYINIAGLNHSAGLVARYQGMGDKNYYLARLTRSSTGLTAQLLRNLNGVNTVLATVNIASTTGNVRLRFLVTGINLKVFVNSALVINAMDSSLGKGSVGIRSDAFASLDEFRVSTVATALPFADNFNQADETGLGGNWTPRAGNFVVKGNVVIGTAPVPAVNVATLIGLLTPNVEVQANVAIVTTNHQVGLLAAYSGVGDSNYYMARVLKTAAGFNLALIKNVAGIVTTLTSINVPALTGPIRFRVEGTSLKLFLNGAELLHAADSSLTTGSVGIRTVGAGTLDNFSVAAVPFVPFTDAFLAPGLSSNWITRAGAFDLIAPLAPNAAFGKTNLNLATLGRFDLADVDVQALFTVNNASGNFSSLVARYSGTGDSNMYLATIAVGASGPVASISKKVNGVNTVLASVPVGISTGTLRFTVIGSQLKLFLDGALLLSTSDFSLKKGSVGIRSSHGSVLDDFSVKPAS